MEKFMHVLGLHVLNALKQRANDLEWLWHHSSAETRMDIVICNRDFQVEVQAPSEGGRDHHGIFVIAARVQAEHQVWVA